MQCGLGLLHPDYTEERNKREEAIVLGFGATVQQKNGVRVHSGGFLHARAHSTLHCANIRPFGLPPLKLPGFQVLPRCCQNL